MRTNLVRFAVLMAAAESIGGGGAAPAAEPEKPLTTDGTNAAETASTAANAATGAAMAAATSAASAERAAAEAAAAAAAAAAPDPVAASIATARDWIESQGVDPERAAQWLADQCPDAFKDADAAAAAISQ